MNFADNARATAATLTTDRGHHRIGTVVHVVAALGLKKTDDATVPTAPDLRGNHLPRTKTTDETAIEQPASIARRVSVWWKPSNESSLRADVAGMKTTLCATDVIIYCGFAPQQNGSFGVPANGRSNLGDPALCRPAVSEARRSGLAVQLVVEGRFGASIRAAVARVVQLSATT